LNYNLSPLAEANGNEKTILLSLPSHLCDGLVKKPALALAKKTLLLIITLFGTVNILKSDFTVRTSAYLHIYTSKNITFATL
jgi:hypothetical protein